MHIGFRTSGGRGEYEVVGNHSGYSAASLEGWTFFLHWPDGIVRDTGLWLDPAESGKPRLRSMLKPEIQIGRIVASMLILPDPTRAFRNTPVNRPILVAKKYSVTQVGFGPQSDFAEISERVTFTPSWIEVSNQGVSDAIGVTVRWQRIQAVYAQADRLNPSLQDLLRRHRDYLAQGKSVDSSLPSIVASIGRQLSDMTSGRHIEGTDPLTSLEEILGIPKPDGPELPPPNELTEDEPAISARSAHEYRLAKIRGASGQRFSETVRMAYNQTCAFCGARLGGLAGIPSGIDAAHILAWSKHDLDVICNGLALCKLHHWAFDAGLLLIRKEDGEYFTRFTALADQLDERAQDRLGAHGERIPEEWLPADPLQHPSERYLNLLYADLGVIWRDAD